MLRRTLPFALLGLLAGSAVVRADRDPSRRTFDRFRDLAPHQAIAEHGLSDEDQFADYDHTASYRSVNGDGAIETRIEASTYFHLVNGKPVRPVYSDADEGPMKRGQALRGHRQVARLLLRLGQQARTWKFPQTRDKAALEVTAERRGESVTVWTTTRAKFGGKGSRAPRR